MPCFSRCGGISNILQHFLLNRYLNRKHKFTRFNPLLLEPLDILCTRCSATIANNLPKILLKQIWLHACLWHAMILIMNLLHCAQTLQICHNNLVWSYKMQSKLHPKLTSFTILDCARKESIHMVHFNGPWLLSFTISDRAQTISRTELQCGPSNFNNTWLCSNKNFMHIT
jgi:hypothetical protein